MKCIGKDVVSGSTIEVDFDQSIRSVSATAGLAQSYLAPAWIDIQVNGYFGTDFNSPGTSHDQIARAIRYLHSTGVSRFYPTVITGGPEQMAGALANLARAKESLEEGPAMAGFHVEGPYISPEDGPRGAHPRRWTRPPGLDEFLRFQDAAQGHVRLLTLSPEWPGAAGFIERVVDTGVVVSLGHTKAEAPQIADAVAAGATMSTHLGNGAHSTLRRHPNYIWDQLADDRLMASFIVDGIHLPQAFVKAAIRAKCVERSVLVTDASTPAECPPGRYALGEQEVDLTADGRVVLAGQNRLAGSALRMDRGIENLQRLAGISLAGAVRMSTVNAALAGNVPGRKQGLVAGDLADLVLFQVDPATGRVAVEGTWLAGKRVYG
ncbi:MAG: N-acetylglucosamine-6-phosphate deacetylase [Bryobacteraceae bacterium]